MRTDSDSEFARAVYQLVASVPPGKVSSYGQIAKLAGFPRHARFVGRLLSQLPPGSSLPWWRILRGNGEIAVAGETAERQQQHLLEEGVSVIGGRVSLSRFGWQP